LSLIATVQINVVPAKLLVKFIVAVSPSVIFRLDGVVITSGISH
jgi:hypothetical protein